MYVPWLIVSNLNFCVFQAETKKNENRNKIFKKTSKIKDNEFNPIQSELEATEIAFKADIVKELEDHDVIEAVPVENADIKNQTEEDTIGKRVVLFNF